MPFFRKIRRSSWDLYSGYSHYVPGLSGVLLLLLLFVVGNSLGSFVSFIFGSCFNTENAMAYSMLVAYPVIFIPAMVYCSVKSRNNEMFDTGYAMDSSNFGRIGGWKLALMVSVVTVAAAILMDPVNSIMPPMPSRLEIAMKRLTEGFPLWATLLSVSVLAPIFEEWLCRGMILRGLLQKINPAAAMAISALCFALIHFNIWQALPAFVLGMLFAYVYYKTGSLKLTMLMHCVNNTFSVLTSRLDTMKDVDFLSQVMEKWQYVTLLCCCLILIVLFIDILWKNIPMKSERGNIDTIDAKDMASI